jgi:pimeloyl-ACP methyl ester carboxylesterase
MIPDLEHHFISTNGIRLHVVQAGPMDGPLVVLLHGFPEFWYGWRFQIPYLSKAGFRVWAPDMRGYNLSDKPETIEAYSIDELAMDIVGLIESSGRENAFVVGHDWGAAVGWWMAMKHSRKVRRMVVLNVPHPNVMASTLQRSPVQMLKSSYILFFQLPWIPEATARLTNWHMVGCAMRISSRSGTFTDSDLDRYRAAWSRPKAYTSMLNWYRAFFRKIHQPPGNRRISVPTRIIWGAEDMFLGQEMARASLELCHSGDLIFIENATHWLQHEEAHRVNLLIEGFLQASSDERR